LTSRWLLSCWDIHTVFTRRDGVEGAGIPSGWLIHGSMVNNTINIIITAAENDKDGLTCRKQKLLPKKPMIHPKQSKDFP